MLDYVTVQSRVHRRLAAPWRDVTDERVWERVEYLHPAGRAFGRDRVALDAWTADWCDREREGLPEGVSIRWESDGPDRVRPRALLLEDVVAAARFVGVDCLAHVEWVREIVAALRVAGASPSAEAVRLVVRAVDAGGVSVDDLVRAVRWVLMCDDLSPWSCQSAGADAGLHSKWFRQHASLLAKVCGFDVVGQLRARPRTVLFSYLDPGYLGSGRVRRHDSWTTGDELLLPYLPRVVLVVENADSRFAFPRLEGGIVVYGGGDAAPAFLAEVPWPDTRPLIAYWGDLDRDGFEILDAMRRALGDDVRSVLMDRAAYERYAARGLSVDKHGRPLAREARPDPLARLSASERSADGLVCWEGPVRRIEQEAIDPHDAAEAVRLLLNERGARDARPTSELEAGVER